MVEGSKIYCKSILMYKVKIYLKVLLQKTIYWKIYPTFVHCFHYFYFPCIFFSYFPPSDWHTYLCWTIAINPQSKPQAAQFFYRFLSLDYVVYLVYTVIVPSQHIPSCFFIRNSALLPFSSLQLKRLTYQQWLDWLFVWLPPPRRRHTWSEKREN